MPAGLRPVGKFQNAKRTTALVAFCRDRLGGPARRTFSLILWIAYRDIVEHFLLPDLEAANLGNDLWFLRDGAPAHTALETRQFLVELVERKNNRSFC